MPSETAHPKFASQDRVLLPWRDGYPAGRASRPPTVDKLRSPRPYFWLVRCLVLNVIDVRCVLDNVVYQFLEVTENIISREIR